MKRFASKLLFQYRVDFGGESNRMRTAEERIILIEANSARSAISKAKKRAKSAEVAYVNNDGNEVFIEFVGVLDLMELGVECEEDEVWYEIKTLREPMERRSKLIPLEDDLIRRVTESSSKSPV